VLRMEGPGGRSVRLEQHALAPHRDAGSESGRVLDEIVARVDDGTAAVSVTWFNQPWLADRLKPGTPVRLRGKLGRFDPKTLTYTEIAPPAGQSPTNRLNAITRAPDGKLWFIDGGPNRRWLSYDPKTKEFEVYELPKLKSGSASGNTMRA